MVSLTSFTTAQALRRTSASTSKAISSKCLAASRSITRPTRIGKPAEGFTRPDDVLDAVAILFEAETARFDTKTTYDALNRVASKTTPDGSVTVPAYNETRLLEQLRVDVRGATPRLVIENIDYDARGQRVRCTYANPDTEAVTTHIDYTYDAKTFRLI